MLVQSAFSTSLLGRTKVAENKEAVVHRCRNRRACLGGYLVRNLRKVDRAIRAIRRRIGRALKEMSKSDESVFASAGKFAIFRYVNLVMQAFCFISPLIYMHSSIANVLFVFCY